MKLIMENWKKFLNERVKISDQEADAFGKALGKAFEGGPVAVHALMNTPMGKTIKFRKFLGVTGARHLDATAGDDVVSVTKGDMPVADLIPTQRFIDLNQSVGFPLGSADNLLRDVTNKKGFGPITVSGEHIIDGHHRWSGIFSIAPDATISVVNLDFQGENVADKLAAAQIAVGAVDPRPQDDHPSKSGKADANILGASSKGIKAILDTYQGQQLDKKAPGPILGDEMLQQIATDPKYQPILDWAGYDPQGGQADLAQLAEAIKAKVALNLSKLNKPPAGSPPREDMPQMDHSTIGGSKGLKKIKSRIAKGDINLAPPFNK